MILLEVENRAVLDSLNKHCDAANANGRTSSVDAKMCDFDGCIYHLKNPNGDREKLQVNIEILFPLLQIMTL